MSNDTSKRPASITILALLSILCALSFVLPVVTIGTVVSLSDSPRLLSQLAESFKVSTAQMQLGALVLVFQMLLFFVIGAGLFWRLKIAWYLLMGFVLDGTLVPLIMLGAGGSSASYFVSGLTIINSLACLMVLYYLLRPEMRNWFELSISDKLRFSLLLALSLLVNLPLYYLGRFVNLG